MRVDRPLLLLLSALTFGCADPEPFVDFGTITGKSPDKPQDPVLNTGRLNICFSDKTPWTEVEQLAAERCAAHGLRIYSSSVQRWQCRATSPHMASFQCYDPDMLHANGAPVNPFDPNDVDKWEKETGKTAKPHNAMTARSKGLPGAPPPAAATPAEAGAPGIAPAAPPAPAPAPAPAPVAPLSPADIAGKPPIPALPPRPAAPQRPAEGAYPTEGFTLPQGSWGDNFQE